MFKDVQIEIKENEVKSKITLSDFSEGSYIIQQIGAMKNNSNEVIARTVCGIPEKTVLTSFKCSLDFSRNLYVMKSELFDVSDRLVDSREDFICL